jgi:hypothetical protein
MNANDLLKQAPLRRQRRDELFSMLPFLRESSDPLVVEMIANWDEKFKSLGLPTPPLDSKS